MHPYRVLGESRGDEVVVRRLDRHVPGVQRAVLGRVRDHLAPAAVGVQQQVAGAQVAGLDPGAAGDRPAIDRALGVDHVSRDLRVRPVCRHGEVGVDQVRNNNLQGAALFGANLHGYRDVIFV